MGGCRCSYKNCQNTTKSMDNIHFFHYPVKHKERCLLWIKNACKPKFCELEEEQLRNKVICEIHFEDKWFPNTQKKRLLQGAVPTLDGDCEDQVSSSEQPAFVPTLNNDIQVLPANDDGTVFVLDTDNMYPTSKKVESFIFKNGVLVPCSQPQVKSRTGSRASNFRMSQEQYSVMECESTPYVEDGNSKLDELMIKKEMDEQHNMKNIEGEYTDFQEATILNEVEPANNASNVRKTETSKSAAGTSSRGAVNRNCLRKIKQHSRDIATIKRLLRQKMEADKAERERERPFDLRKALVMLQQHVPPTLFTIVSLLLGEKNELNDDDIEFFTTIHRTSPEVYQLLSDKYKWNLPSVDVVDMPGE